MLPFHFIQELNLGSCIPEEEVQHSVLPETSKGFVYLAMDKCVLDFFLQYTVQLVYVTDSSYTVRIASAKK